VPLNEQLSYSRAHGIQVVPSITTGAEADAGWPERVWSDDTGSQPSSSVAPTTRQIALVRCIAVTLAHRVSPCIALP